MHARCGLPGLWSWSEALSHCPPHQYCTRCPGSGGVGTLHIQAFQCSCAGLWRWNPPMAGAQILHLARKDGAVQRLTTWRRVGQTWGVMRRGARHT